MSNSIYDYIDDDMYDEIGPIAPEKEPDEKDNNKKNGNGWTVAFVIIVLLGIGFVCNHVQEEAKKLDGFTDFILGTTIFGLVCLCIYFYSKNK